MAQDEGPIIAVSGPLSWPFFAAVKQGFDDAAEIFGVEYQYVAVTDTANMTSDYPRLLQQAISRNPRMLLVGEFFPDGMDPLISRAGKRSLALPAKVAHVASPTHHVMPGLDPGIHVIAVPRQAATGVGCAVMAWMAGSSPAMTVEGSQRGRLFVDAAGGIRDVDGARRNHHLSSP